MKNVKKLSNLAELTYQSGAFNKAQNLLQQAQKTMKLPVKVRMLFGKLESLLGNYNKAEEIFNKLVADSSVDAQTKIMVQIELLFVFYNTNQFHKSHNILKGMEGKIQLPQWDLMKSFKENPYQISWQGKSPDKNQHRQRMQQSPSLSS